MSRFSRSHVRAVIFDVDGTLVDSVDLHAQAWLEAFREIGKNLSFAEVRFQIGKGADQLIPAFLDREQVKTLGPQLSKRHDEIFVTRYRSQVRAFPQVRELFERLRADGKSIALASSAKEEDLEYCKKLTHIEGLVQEQTTSEDAEKSKPHPDIFAAALERLGNPPADETIVIGDTPYDIEAAGKINLRTVAVRCGGFPESALLGAVAIYDDPADLLTRYTDSPIG